MISFYMQKWEYKVVECKRKFGLFSGCEWSLNMEEMLPQLGEEGWELVNVVSESSSWGNSTAGATTEEKWIFKRPKLD